MSDLILKSINRQPFNWLEIDMPKCLLDYGNGLCKAVKGVTGADKCYNTRATCQDAGNYDATDNVLTYSFCENRGYIPDDRYWLPYLEHVSITPASLNLGGGNKNKSALGTMATLSATFADHPHTDRIVDPYLDERDFDPYKRSTFWAKWRARNPYYMHREVRYYSGFIDPATGYVDPATLIVRTFFVTGFGGFSAGGNVTLKAADIMTFLANDKAKAPKASKGKLSGDINTGSGNFTLTPSGIGDLDYPASGKVRINKEVMSFTRVGDDLSVTRGIANTEAAEHKAGDTVQLNLEIVAQKPNEILEMIETVYAGIPAKYLDTAQWATEVTDHLPRLYSALITEPTGVFQLISEMAEQMYFTTVWDERNARQYIKSVRPADGEAIIDLNDNRNLLEDSVTWNDEADQLITDVWVYYGQKNPTIKLDEGTNYSALDVISDTSSKGVDRNNTERIKVIHSRWINEGGAAIDLGEKTLARYNEIPRSCSFSLDAKDGSLWLADFITLQNRHVVDTSGQSVPVAMQVISAQESVQGTTYSYVAQQYSGNTIGDSTGELQLSISNDFVNLNLREYYDKNIGTAPVSGDKIRFTIRSGVTIGGCAFTDVNNISDVPVTSTDGSTTIASLEFIALFNGASAYYDGATRLIRTREMIKIQRRGLLVATDYSVDSSYGNARLKTNPINLECEVKEFPVRQSIAMGAWPAGVEIFLDIEAGATVYGEGGNATLSHSKSTYLAPSGLAFLPALAGDGGDALDITHPITINNLGRIAGGGGAGATYYNDKTAVLAGGGGAGYRNGIVGVGYKNVSSLGNVPLFSHTLASNGSKTTGGSGAQFKFFPVSPTQYSGNGGNLSQDGSDTANSFHKGLAGAAVSQGANLITWINKGTVLGAENV